MNYLRLMLLVCFLVIITGCLSPQERRAQREAKIQNIIDQSRAQCAGYGYRLGTDAFAACVQSEVHDFQLNAERKRKVSACEAAMWNKPTRTGKFYEKLNMVNECKTDPNAHLRY